MAAKALSSDIQVTLDSTKVPHNMKILVFGHVKKNHIITSQDVDVAWDVIPSGNTSTFTYPLSTKVGIFYKSGTYSSNVTTVLSGDAAAPGTTWNYLAQSESDSGTLTLDEFVPVRTSGLYAILNKKPATWSGRVINVGLYKNDKLFIIEPSVGVGNYAELTIHDKLYFAVLVSNSDSTMIVPGRKFIPNFVGAVPAVAPTPIYPGIIQAQISQLKEVDLTQYPNGVTVTLTENPLTQQFEFKSTPTL